MKLTNIVSTILLSSTLAVVSARAEADGCKPVAGPFTSSVVTGPGCSPPDAVLCTLGNLEGNFHATYSFTMTSLVPDAEDPNILHYTGESVITLRNGKKLFAVDSGFMDATDPTAAQFVTTATIVGGTGQYQSGQIVATGTLNLLTGEAVGTHAGEICKAKKNQ